MRILIAEDDAALADGLQHTLRQSGHAVDWVKNGGEADAALDTNEFDLLILDISLPKLCGFEVLKRLRARFPDICIVVGRWGSDDIEDDARPLLAAGANRVGATLAATRDHVLELLPPARQAQPLPRSA